MANKNNNNIDNIPPNLLKMKLANFILQEKKESIFVHINTLVKQIPFAPEFLLSKMSFILQVGYNLPIPIDNLSIDPSGFSGIFSFRGEPIFCDIPWENVFAILGEDGRGRMWEETIPPNVRKEMAYNERKKSIQLIKNEAHKPGPFDHLDIAKERRVKYNKNIHTHLKAL